MANVKLKDASGTEVTYNGVASVTLPTAEGGTATFSIITPYLTADTTYYISPNGSDSNDGLSSSTPVKTSARLQSIIPNALMGFTATVQFLTGTYSDEAIYLHDKRGGTLTLELGSNTYGRVVVDYCDTVVLSGSPTFQYYPSNITYPQYDGMLSIKWNLMCRTQLQPMTFVGSSAAKSAHVCGINIRSTTIVGGGSDSNAWNYTDVDRAVSIVYGSFVSVVQKIVCSSVNYAVVATSSIVLLAAPQEPTGAAAIYSTNASRIYHGAQTSVPNY